MKACPGVGESLFFVGRNIRRKSWKRNRVREGVKARGMFDVNPDTGNSKAARLKRKGGLTPPESHYSIFFVYMSHDRSNSALLGR